MLHKKIIGAGLFGAVLALSAASASAESIIVTLTNISSVGLDFQYTYNVKLTNGNEITSVNTSGFAKYGDMTDRPSDFFAVTDVEGLVGTPTFSDSNFTFSLDSSQTTTFPTKHADGSANGFAQSMDGSAPNVVFTYQGTSAIVNNSGSDLLIGTLKIVSSFATVAERSQYGSDTKLASQDDGHNDDPTFVPTSPDNGGGFLPTPAACGGGALLMGLLAVSRRRRQA
jgi:hypothetical protein